MRLNNKTLENLEVFQNLVYIYSHYRFFIVLCLSTLVNMMIMMIWGITAYNYLYVYFSAPIIIIIIIINYVDLFTGRQEGEELSVLGPQPHPHCVW